MRIAVTGSHGLIGTALVQALEAGGHQVTPVVRAGDSGGEGVRWDPMGGTIDAAGLDGHDAVVNLAGPGIGDHRWTDDYKRLVRDARVKGTDLLARTLASLDRPPAVLATGSAVGYYGDRGDEDLTETSGPGSGFLAELVRDWEAAAAPAAEAGIRVVHLRTGIVLSAGGGALKKMLLPFRLGVGGRLGSGRQWFSWISIDDQVGAILHALAGGDVRGPVNFTAPAPVTNAVLTKALGRALHRPTVVPVPRFALRALLGVQLADEMVLGGQRVLPAALETSGYQFRHPTLDEALAAVLH